MHQTELPSEVPECVGRLLIVDERSLAVDVRLIEDSLRRDMVVLVKNLTSDQADLVMHDVADRFRLSDGLALQASFAGFYGHRHNIGKYFMSVNERKEYQFIPPHSEGSSSSGMQIAAFFCFENTTDGGETILMNVDSSSQVWRLLRERVTRLKIGSRALSPTERSRISGMYHLQLPSDALKDDDKILQERQSPIPDLRFVDVLSRPVTTYSRILECDLFSYWDTIGGIDHDSASEFVRLLKDCDLLKQPQNASELMEIDNCASRRIWHSGVAYRELFKCRITRKMVPGDLIIQNNLTWTHGASNWTPGSGTRLISASFA